jgi:Concanavalin A-like lectin/glucanases superfamily
VTARRFERAVLSGAALTYLLAIPLASEIARAETWTFDRVDKIGGLPTTIVGHPHVIKTTLGKAVQFDGVGDALFIPKHPLAGAEVFTFEAIFRPESGGAPEQRWFHLAEQDPKTGADTEIRMLLEIRVINGQWSLDGFVNSAAGGATLLNTQLLHTLDAWHHAAMVFDGKELSIYVDGVLQDSKAIHFTPEGPGHSSVGVRINKINYFKGSVRAARFTTKALRPDEFLQLPGKSK